MTYTSDREELRKRVTSFVSEGARLALLDNIVGQFGNDVLDAALTATVWKDRLLGTNQTITAPLQIVWFATGNNIAVGADTARRVLPIRLETAE
jgi:putative DNA primase/helicase